MLLDGDPARAFVPYPPTPVAHAPAGPLSGMTFAVKDLVDVAGYPTGGGSPHVLAMSGTKAETAPVVQRFLDAGAAFVGKTHTDELAFSMIGRNIHFGTPRNGAAPDRIPGGSSSGSAAAVSNNLCDFALGTDTGGSVRAPASHCGLFGIRPTHGRLSLSGCLDLAPSFDTFGFFAATSDTFVRVAEVAFGRDSHPLPAKPRPLLAANAFAMLEREARAALAPCVSAIEAELGEAELIDAGGVDFSVLFDAFRYLQAREAWETDGELIERFAIPLGPGVAERFAFGKMVTDAQVEESRQVQVQFAERLRGLLGRDGVLVLPTMPDIAPLLSESDENMEDYRSRSVRLLCLAGLSGLPQVSMPVAQRLDAPFGLSILGPAWSDLSLVQLSARLAEVCG